MKHTLSQFIQDCGHTAIETASAIGMSQHTLANYSRLGNTVATMPAGTFLRLACILDVMPEQLMKACGPDDIDDVCNRISERRPSADKIQALQDELDRYIQIIHCHEQRLNRLKQYVSGAEQFQLPRTNFDADVSVRLALLCQEDVNDIKKMRIEAKQKK